MRNLSLSGILLQRQSRAKLHLFTTLSIDPSEYHASVTVEFGLEGHFVGLYY